MSLKSNKNSLRIKRDDSYLSHYDLFCDLVMEINSLGLNEYDLITCNLCMEYFPKQIGEITGNLCLACFEEINYGHLYFWKTDIGAGSVSYYSSPDDDPCLHNGIRILEESNHDPISIEYAKYVLKNILRKQL
jgi:hypothetical protein